MAWRTSRGERGGSGAARVTCAIILLSRPALAAQQSQACAMFVGIGWLAGIE